MPSNGAPNYYVYFYGERADEERQALGVVVISYQEWLPGPTAAYYEDYQEKKSLPVYLGESSFIVTGLNISDIGNRSLFYASAYTARARAYHSVEDILDIEPRSPSKMIGDSLKKRALIDLRGTTSTTTPSIPTPPRTIPQSTSTTVATSSPNTPILLVIVMITAFIGISLAYKARPLEIKYKLRTHTKTKISTKIQKPTSEEPTTSKVITVEKSTFRHALTVEYEQLSKELKKMERKTINLTDSYASAR